MSVIKFRNREKSLLLLGSDLFSLLKRSESSSPSCRCYSSLFYSFEINVQLFLRFRSFIHIFPFSFVQDPLFEFSLLCYSLFFSFLWVCTYKDTHGYTQEREREQRSKRRKSGKGPNTDRFIFIRDVMVYFSFLREKFAEELFNVKHRQHLGEDVEKKF